MRIGVVVAVVEVVDEAVLQLLRNRLRACPTAP
jgi:hypothetical protein